jgi:hypothetical protein
MGALVGSSRNGLIASLSATWRARRIDAALEIANGWGKVKDWEKLTTLLARS